MKRLLALCLLAWCGLVNGQALTVLLTGIRLFNADRTETYYAKVQARGADFEAAKTRAFRLAVEEAAGTVVLSETELRDQRIRRDEIVTYSSGFVDRYNVLSRQDLGNSVEIVIEVWVAHSAIANRLLAKNADEKSIDGARLATQHETIVDERTRGDKLLQTVLNDHPRRSLTVRLRAPEIAMNHSRELTVAVHWEIHWSDLYLKSLQETVKQFRVGVCWSTCAKRFGLLGYDVEDAAKAWQVYNHLARTPVAMLILLEDNQHRIVHRTCVPIDLAGSMVTAYNDTVSTPNVYLTGTQRMNFGINSQYIGSVSRFNGRVIERSQCPS